ncbi:MAG: hypothetical protein K8R60_24230 [Burkholderiales bacterium]|nr:hypothetical protein [Burkholderiales bacterium]
MSAVLPGGAAATPRGPAGSVSQPILAPNLASATQRLEASRARLRSALMTIAHPPAKPSLLDDLKLGTFGTQIFDRLKALPGAALALEILEHWWAEHPLHAAGALAEQASRRYIGPFAKKNPLAIIVGGVVLGVLLAFSKPWRWLLRPALFAGLLPQLASQTLKRLPLDSWLRMLSSLTAKRPAAKAGAGPQASPLPKDS